jgi:hypothetical protein
MGWRPNAMGVTGHNALGTWLILVTALLGCAVIGGLA